MNGGLMNKTKYSIAKKIRNYTTDEIKNDLDKLKLLPCNENIQKTIIGNKIVDSATFPERLDAKGKKNINYYDLFNKRNELMKKKYVKNFYNYLLLSKLYTKDEEEKIWFKIKSVYFGSVNSFKPSIAKYLYCFYDAKNILDFSAGWGGRLVGAMVLPNTKYIGIDTNKDLKNGYSYLIDLLNCKNRVKMIWKDSSKVDYSKLKYDFVMTSPPYYYVEKYNNMPLYKNKEEFIKKYWYPTITKVWYNLDKKGKMLLNMPENMYDETVKIIGVADEIIPLYKSSRKKELTKNENIYLWYKN